MSLTPAIFAAVGETQRRCILVAWGVE